MELVNGGNCLSVGHLGQSRKAGRCERWSANWRQLITKAYGMPREVNATESSKLENYIKGLSHKLR